MTTTKFVIYGAILLLSATGAMAQMRQGGMAVAEACKPDIRQFCSNVPPGRRPHQGLYEGARPGALRTL
jgi:hypothetical protein